MPEGACESDWVQYSVFVCELSPKERVMLVTNLKEVVDPSEDSVMIVDLGPGSPEKRIESLGSRRKLPSRQATVV